MEEEDVISSIHKMIVLLFQKYIIRTNIKGHFVDISGVSGTNCIRIAAKYSI